MRFLCICAMILNGAAGDDESTAPHPRTVETLGINGMVAREGHAAKKLWWGIRGQFSGSSNINRTSGHIMLVDILGSCEDFPCLESGSPPHETPLSFCEALVILPGLGCNRTAVLADVRSRYSQPHDDRDRALEHVEFDCIRHCPALWSPLSVGIPSRTVPYLHSSIEIPAFQMQVLNPARDAYLSPTIVANREWDPPKTAAFATILGRPYNHRPLFVDVGANVGYFSLLAAAMGCDVLAIEPQREPFELLLSSVLANAFDGLIRPKNVLLSACGTNNSFKLEQSRSQAGNISQALRMSCMRKRVAPTACAAPAWTSCCLSYPRERPFAF